MIMGLPLQTAMEMPLIFCMCLPCEWPGAPTRCLVATVDAICIVLSLFLLSAFGLLLLEIHLI